MSEYKILVLGRMFCSDVSVISYKKLDIFYRLPNGAHCRTKWCHVL